MFNSLQRKPFILNREISLIHRLSRVFMDQGMESYGLSSGQYVYLFHLLENDGASQDDISKALEVDKASTARVVQKFEDFGLVVRVQDLKDKRVNRVFVTDKGRELSLPLKQRSKTLQDHLLEGFSEEEKVLLSDFIAKMAQNASGLNKRGAK